MFKYIRDWQDRRLKKRMERIFCSYVLDCDIDVKGCVAALGAKEIAWWRIDDKKKPLPLEWQEGITPKMIMDDINHKNKIKMKKYYVDSHAKIIVTCKKHGDFETTPNRMLNGCGCSKCKSEKAHKQYSKSTSKFIEEARLVHGDLYDYSLCNYYNTHTKVTIKGSVKCSFHIQ